MTLQCVHEEKLLGTAGSLLANRRFFQDATGLLIHADNATNADLRPFLLAHKSRHRDCLMTMLTFSSSSPSSCGIVETDCHGVVTAFHEKVSHPPSDQANGAIYLFDASFIDWLDSLSFTPSDFSTEVLPNLLGRIQTWHTKDLFLDIGTPAALKEAQRVFQPGLGAR